MVEDKKQAALPEPMRRRYEVLQIDILKRLEEFSKISRDSYFYELCFCLLTPQSKARNADAAVQTLMNLKFAEKGFDPVEILVSPNHYIRFHNTKARRLLAAREQIGDMQALLSEGLPPTRERDWIVANITGLGMKEASHFLRNIGRRGLAIIDRHIIKHLNQCGLEVKPECVGSRRYYEEVERSWINFCIHESIPIDEMDLLFWSAETGEILK